VKVKRGKKDLELAETVDITLSIKEIREKSFGTILWNIFDASLLAILIFTAFAFLLKLDVQSRT